MDAFIHSTAVIEEGAIIGHGTKVWCYSHVMGGARVGPGCVIGQGCYVASRAVVGSRCKIQNHVSLCNGLVIEDDVFVGPCASFANIKCPRAFRPEPGQFLSIRIKKGATVGANATILGGVTIGRYAIIAAGAVVSFDVPDRSIVMGPKSEVVGTVKDIGDGA